MNIRELALSLLALATIGSSACDAGSCTDAGCTTGATFRVEGTRGFTSGEWYVDLELDGNIWSSTCQADTRECEALEGPQTSLELEVFLSNDGVAFVSFAAADPDDLPDSYDLRVSSGDLIGGEASGDLDYDAVRPNGPGCGPVCDYVEIEV